MHRALVIAVVAACRFEPGVLPEGRGGGGGAGGTGVDSNGADTTTGNDTQTATAFCDTTNSSLVACYEFENTTTDATSNNLDPVTANVTYVTGRAGMAVRLSSTSAMDVPEVSALDVPYLTLEAWIRPTTIPSVRSGIIDNDGQYSLYLYAGGDLRCRGYQLAASIQPNVWTHVACTIDADIKIYKNGTLIGTSVGAGGMLSSGGTNGMSIGMDNPPGSGQQLIGDLDQLRMFDAARTAQQICDAAGQTSC